MRKPNNNKQMQQNIVDNRYFIIGLQKEREIILNLLEKKHPGIKKDFRKEIEKIQKQAQVKQNE